MKNIDRIKEMNVDDLAAFLCNLMCADCCEERCPARDKCRKGHTGMKYWLNAEEDVGPIVEAIIELR